MRIQRATTANNTWTSHPTEPLLADARGPHAAAGDSPPGFSDRAQATTATLTRFTQPLSSKHADLHREDSRFA